ncbi:MAG: (2Fe-2S) ferredoxin domain-containing protein [Clostridium sp.]|uniref:(2Fe-2S) ferredoxin domain-containing protein n=1 Tax=Clostridium sp. TaxID=1506 RepID=UPI002FC833D9
MIIKVCVGSACYVKGSHSVINEIKRLIELNNLDSEIELKAAFCLGHCTSSVSILVDDVLHSVNETNVNDFFEEVILRRVR